MRSAYAPIPQLAVAEEGTHGSLSKIALGGKMPDGFHGEVAVGKRGRAAGVSWSSAHPVCRHLFACFSPSGFRYSYSYGGQFLSEMTICASGGVVITTKELPNLCGVTAIGFATVLSKYLHHKRRVITVISNSLIPLLK